jgi:hypothetical protein
VEALPAGQESQPGLFSLAFAEVVGMDAAALLP